MFKFFLRWIDSWSIPNRSKSNEIESSIAIKDTQIQWLRIIPFILLHIACLAVFWVGVSWFALIFMFAFYLIRMFAITGFFHRYLSHKTFQTSRPVQFFSFLLAQ